MRPRFPSIRIRSPRWPRGWRAALPLTAVALAATALFFTPLTSASADSTLLSRGKPATASSSENTTVYPASAAVDGDQNTRWSSAFADPQWLQVDLGATATIDRVVLTWEAAYGTSFQIQVSPDASAWTPVYTTTGTGGTQTLAVTGSGRYVRLTGTQRGTTYGYSLWEMGVYRQ